MKKTTLMLSALLIAAMAMGGNEMYYKKMGEALAQFSSSKSLDDYQDLANHFQVISGVETAEWLPIYYEAQCYIMIGFMNDLETEKRDSYLAMALTAIDRMIEMAPREAEIHALAALCYTASMTINPAERNPGTAPLIYAALGKALAFEPENPRARFISISNEIGTARFFGSDTAPLCEKASQLLESWDSYVPKSPLYPTWGKMQAQGIVNSCGH
ncbi:MAG: hypothetical protein QNK35_09050 [Bacteroides sp.]|nr:hypothetical protein [Bacteroides sp.]